jgi:hypothetical protein
VISFTGIDDDENNEGDNFVHEASKATNASLILSRDQLGRSENFAGANVGVLVMDNFVSGCIDPVKGKHDVRHSKLIAIRTENLIMPVIFHYDE